MRAPLIVACSSHPTVASRFSRARRRSVIDAVASQFGEPAIEGATMIKEFKDFLFRGNIVELAVAFVMGLAFAAVVNSLVNNLVMPIIAAIIGKPDFRNLTFTIHRSVFHYGAFLTDLIQFAAIGAAVFFFIVKPVQMMLARNRKEPIEEGMPDEERRHQELLSALRASS
jgi:large conductance mechanosensitive channel